jgi:hypothetical protein
LGKEAGRGAKKVKNRRLASLWLSALVLAVFPVAALKAAKYPPGQRWRELDRGRFTVIFPASRALEAGMALAAAERLDGELGGFWRSSLRGRVRVVLDDSTDQPNGFATFSPYDLVGINLAEPPPDSELAAGRSWIDLVMAHEMTHIFTLNSGSAPFRVARRLFGTNPVFYPATQMPPWAIEGLAVYGESRFTRDGRLDHPPYRLMLDAARRDDRFPDWQRVAGLPAAWPGPTSRYLYGAGFMDYLARQYGSDALLRYLDRTSGRLVLFSSSRDFKKTFGTPLGMLWDGYRNERPAAAAAAREPLADRGFANRYPCARGANSLAYYHRGYRGQGEVALLDLDSGKSRALFRMDAVTGLSCNNDRDKLLLSATEYFHAFSVLSDLYEYDVKKGRLARLSRGGRLSHPVRSDQGEWLYCVQRRDNRSRLALFSMKKRQARSISMSFAGLAQLSLSPDGTRIAAAAKPAGGPWGIAVFLENGSLVRFLSMAGSDLSQPRWQGNHTLLFIVSGKETSHLASYSLDSEGSWRLEDAQLSGLRQFDLSQDGKEIFFTYYSGRGEEIARHMLSATPLTPMEITVASGIPDAAADLPPTAPLRSRAYRPWRDLLPRWWSPALRQGGDEIQAGFITGGQDALDIHAFSLEGYYGLSSRRPNLLLRYVYDGLFPTFSLSYSDSIEYFRDAYFIGRTQELTLASYWPLRLRKRSRLYAYADLHLEKQGIIYEDKGFEFGSRRSNGFRLGLDLNSARDYHDSISAADGIRLTLQGSVQPAGMGNKRASRSAQADLRFYLPLSRPGVLAGRLALARSWDAGPSYYDLGGREVGGGLGNDRPFRLLRGFPAGFQWGDRGWQVNLEYRLPLFKIEKTILPAVSLDRVWLSPFFDAGRLASRYAADPVAYAVGAEAVLRLAFGGSAATDLAFGIAHGFGAREDLWIYLRMGRSF